MAARKTEETLHNRFPVTIQFRDVVSLITVAVSITLAYGVFSSRIVVLEKEAIHAAKERAELVTAVDRLQMQQQRINSLIQENDSQHDYFYRELKKPIPPRHRPIE